MTARRAAPGGGGQQPALWDMPPGGPRIDESRIRAVEGYLRSRRADADDLAAILAPPDLATVLAAADWALRAAMVLRGEVYHQRNCRGRHVNSRPVACSDDCMRVQVALAWVVGTREQGTQVRERESA